jgi:hypothetical protein
MLINFSNHPSVKWDESQLQEAKRLFGTVADLPFPGVDPGASEKDIEHLAKSYFGKITSMLDECANEPSPNAVHIQGEFTFAFALVSMLLSSGIRCVASTSHRRVTELENGTKNITFAFVRFRDYRLHDN